MVLEKLGDVIFWKLNTSKAKRVVTSLLGHGKTIPTSNYLILKRKAPDRPGLFLFGCLGNVDLIYMASFSSIYTDLNIT